MAIKSSTFGRVELTGKDAARFVQHLVEDKASPLALAALARGRQIRERIQKGEGFKLKSDV
jgi:glycine cleavage system aminomethyltransferase T